ncbi:hypothetical protein C8R45DRAFT_1038983 [Mycena sanguinolenta]|nr:hypothetical protein C8R45DRAFT_1038983 [Mycena sanguinolenta]
MPLVVESPAFNHDAPMQDFNEPPSGSNRSRNARRTQPRDVSTRPRGSRCTKIKTREAGPSGFTPPNLMEMGSESLDPAYYLGGLGESFPGYSNIVHSGNEEFRPHHVSSVNGEAIPSQPSSSSIQIDSGYEPSAHGFPKSRPSAAAGRRTRKQTTTPRNAYFRDSDDDRAIRNQASTSKIPPGPERRSEFGLSDQTTSRRKTPTNKAPQKGNTSRQKSRDSKRPKGTISCSLESCDATFTRPADLERHQANTEAHRKDGSKLNCPLCGTLQSRSDALRRHLRDKHHMEDKTDIDQMTMDAEEKQKQRKETDGKAGDEREHEKGQEDQEDETE